MRVGNPNMVSGYQEFVELKLTTVKQKYFFPDIENLRAKPVKMIEIFQVANVSRSPENNAIINATAFKEGFLVLYVAGREDINREPFTSFDPIANYGKRVEVDNIFVDWPKSYIEFPRTDSLVANESVLLNVWYEKFPSEELMKKYVNR